MPCRSPQTHLDMELIFSPRHTGEQTWNILLETLTDTASTCSPNLFRHLNLRFMVFHSLGQACAY